MAKNKLQKTFDLPEDCDCREIVIREVTNRDKWDSVGWANASAPAAIKEDSGAMQSFQSRELVRSSVVSIDGQTVDQPCREMDDWSEWTWMLVEKAYCEVNLRDVDALKNLEGRVLAPLQKEHLGSVGS